jgi:hypothetical protein
VDRICRAGRRRAAEKANDGPHFFAQVFDAVCACVWLLAVRRKHPRIVFVPGRFEGEDWCVAVHDLRLYPIPTVLSILLFIIFGLVLATELSE